MKGQSVKDVLLWSSNANVAWCGKYIYPEDDPPTLENEKNGRQSVEDLVLSGLFV